MPSEEPHRPRVAFGATTMAASHQGAGLPWVRGRPSEPISQGGRGHGAVSPTQVPQQLGETPPEEGRTWDRTEGTASIFRISVRSRICGRRWSSTDGQQQSCACPHAPTEFLNPPGWTASPPFPKRSEAQEIGWGDNGARDRKNNICNSPLA